MTERTWKWSIRPLYYFLMSLGCILSEFTAAAQSKSNAYFDNSQNTMFCSKAYHIMAKVNRLKQTVC